MKKRRLLSQLQRDTMAWILIAGFLVMIAAAALYLVAPQMKPRTTLHLGDGVFTADVITKEKGSAVKSSELRELYQNEAVLFSYNEDDWWPVEVRTRSGSFDVVWLDRNKTVVYIVKNISAEHSRNTTFSPNKSARYVVELPVGTVENRAISIGANATFDEAQAESL